jgi:DNA polymerase elongation subunit (family B)
MDVINFDDVYNAVKTNRLNFYNIYAADLDIPSYFSAKYYHENPKDSIDIDQSITKLFTDIEVYTYHKGLDFKNLGQDPISAITFYSNVEKIYHAYIYLLNDDITNKFDDVDARNKEFYKFLVDHKYINTDDQINIRTYNDECQLICDYWEKVKELDHTILSGFNSDTFDYPYLYERLSTLTDKDSAAKTMSIFSYVGYRNGFISIPEFTISDLLYLYKPRSEGGLNFGKMQTQYSLDYLSEVFLNTKKVEYNGNLDTLFEEDPATYLLYNIGDVALTKSLDSKWQHIEVIH